MWVKRHCPASAAQVASRVGSRCRGSSGTIDVVIRGITQARYHMSRTGKSGSATGKRSGAAQSRVICVPLRKPHHGSTTTGAKEANQRVDLNTLPADHRWKHIAVSNVIRVDDVYDSAPEDFAANHLMDGGAVA